MAQMIIDNAQMVGVKAVRRAMADLLKEECASLVSSTTGRDYKTVLEEMYRDETKERYRLLLQFWGTELRREMCDKDYWVNAMNLWIARNCGPQQIVVIPDIRFPNEIELVNLLNGYNFWVFRPGIENFDTHISETALDDYTAWAGTFMNDQGLPELEKLVRVTLVDLIDRVWGH